MGSESESDEAFETGSEGSFIESWQLQPKTVIYKCNSFRDLVALSTELIKPLEEVIWQTLNDRKAPYMKIRLTITASYRIANGRQTNRRLVGDAYIARDETDLQSVILLLLAPILNGHDSLPPSDSLLALHSAMLNLIPTERADPPKSNQNIPQIRFYYEA